MWHTDIQVRPFSWLRFCKLGWAMEGRGEFSFLIAASAQASGQSVV